MSSFKDKAKGNWNEIKGKIKEEYAEVTEDDLLFEEAQEDQLIGIIQKDWQGQGRSEKFHR
ncbi:CsbD family protein [Algoriphagus halophilus]|uniref:CsbD family protein n=1 Tax=Algoriphagus halophilus TaxID=226505 RepID=UPI0035900F2A